MQQKQLSCNGTVITTAAKKNNTNQQKQHNTKQKEAQMTLQPTHVIFPSFLPLLSIRTLSPVYFCICVH